MSLFRSIGQHPTTHILFACSIFLLVALGVFGPSGQDDAYISFGTAYELAHHLQLGNINGEKVESGSSVLHIALLAISHGLTNIHLPILGIFFSLLFALACLPLSRSLASSINIQHASLVPLALALSTGFIYWAMGSLETTLASAIVLCCIISLSKHLQADDAIWRALSFLSFAAFLLIRPEAFFVCLALMVLLLLIFIKDKTKKHRLLTVLAFVSSLFVIAAALRLHYFDQLFPQPIYAKADQFHAIKILYGLGYFIVSAQISLIICSLCCIILACRYYKQIHTLPVALWVSLSFCLAYMAFIISSGGDWMGGGRFFVPIIPPLFIVFFFLIQQSRRYKQWQYAFFILLAFEVTVFSEQFATGMPLYQSADFLPTSIKHESKNDYQWTETKNYIHANDIVLLHAIMPVIDEALKHQDKVTVAGVQMGMIPYFLRQHYHDKIYFVDMRGLTTQHISHCPAFANAPRLWTGIFVDYQEYFSAQSSCQLPNIDIIYELQNLKPVDNQARLNALQQYGYPLIYTQHTHIRGGFLGNKLLQSPYIIAVSTTIYNRLPTSLRHQEITINNEKIFD